MITSVLLAGIVLWPAAGFGKVDLVTLPHRDKVQITIYNSADLTLARESRSLTMRKGANRLQFSWANTLIDPTSLEMFPKAHSRELTVQDLVFPPRVQGLGIWNVKSGISGEVPVEITFFTSGISWRAYYLATLEPDESSMRLEGYVRVDNRSGEDYRNAETRLIVGKIHLLDRIADLARRQYPFGRPGPEPVPMPMAAVAEGKVEFAKARKAVADMEMAPKEIRKEGLSEYFLYSIEGTEDIFDGWGKRLVSFTADRVPVKNLYRYEEERHGNEPVRFLSFANDEKHNLGGEPIPGGLVKVFRRVDDDHRLSYTGAQTTKYIPEGETVELNLGRSEDVSVEPILMEFATDNYEFNPKQNIIGWDEHHTVRVEVANYRDISVKVEIRRSFPVASWEIDNQGEWGDYRKVDKDTVQYTLELPPGGRKEFTYRVVLHMGTRG
jgi:hypothetical protein